MGDTSRVDLPQKFHCFNEAGSAGSAGEIVGSLRLMKESGEPLPFLRVRMVPGQVDDMLAAALAGRRLGSEECGV
jgi:hypothetical protein